MRFIPTQQAYRLRELGFNFPCIKYIYTGDTANNCDQIGEVLPSKAKDWNKVDMCVSIPTYSQTFECFFERLGLWTMIDPSLDFSAFTPHICTKAKDWKDSDLFTNIREFITPKEAELALLDKLIEIVSERIGAAAISK